MKLPKLLSARLKSKPVKRALIIGVPTLFLFFLIYLGILFNQMKAAFNEQVQFVPTRIYSDVARIAAPQPRTYIDETLQALAYKFQVGQFQGQPSILFKMHPRTYPEFLIPDNHPQRELTEPEVRFVFDSDDKGALLQSVQLNGREVPEIYLEPELAATLSPTGTVQQKVRQPVTFANIPSMIWKAVIAIEDQNFMEHAGLDPKGIARAIWVNTKTLSFSQGGSTITQQLVKNLMARKGRNLFKKFNEVFLALLLEVSFSKEQILERYLNEVYLGQIGNLEVRGVAEGAEHFFGKRLEDISLAEAAFLAGLIRGAIYYSPHRHLDRAVERQKLVLTKMVEVGMITDKEAKAAAKESLRIAPPKSYSTRAPYFTDFVKAELIRQLKEKMNEEQILQAGYRVYTTLDLHMSTLAQTAVATGLQELEARLKLPTLPDGKVAQLEGALATIDQKTGHIKALVGGRNYAQSTFNRILNMKRQVGSTFKPIAYLAAILKGRDAAGVPFGPGYPMRDAPWTLEYEHGTKEWSPKNYEKEYLDWTNLRHALAHSVNTVSAQLAARVGVAKTIEVAKALGIQSDLPAVPSLALGVAELSPVELLRAYSVIANHGMHNEITVIRTITEEDGSHFAHFINDSHQAIEPGAADLLIDMMTAIFTEGTAVSARAMGWDRAAAGKTGTTSEHRDAWFAGFSPQLTTVVWVGMDQYPPKTKISLTGAGAALPIWVKFMKAAHELEPPTPFPVSPHLVDVQIDRHTGKRAEADCASTQVITEKYVRGNEPTLSSCDPLYPNFEPKLVVDGVP